MEPETRLEKTRTDVNENNRRANGEETVEVDEGLVFIFAVGAVDVELLDSFDC